MACQCWNLIDQPEHNENEDNDQKKLCEDLEQEQLLQELQDLLESQHLPSEKENGT